MLLKSQQVVVPGTVVSPPETIFKSPGLFSILLLFDEGVTTINITLPGQGTPPFIHM
jgi:hypothetical protein